jgi:hypothetical protein
VKKVQRSFHQTLSSTKDSSRSTSVNVSKMNFSLILYSIPLNSTQLISHCRSKSSHQTLTTSLSSHVPSAVFSTTNSLDVGFKSSLHFLSLSNQLFPTVYGYVFTKLTQPECDHSAVPLTDLSTCGIPASELTQMDQSKCRIC